MSTFQAHVDQPEENRCYAPFSFPVAGWIAVGERQADLGSVFAMDSRGRRVGSTEHFFARADVASHLGLAPAEKVGFEFRATIPRPAGGGSDPAGEELEVFFTWKSAPDEPAPLGRRRVQLSALDFAALPHGRMLEADQTQVLHRSDIYGSGPSSQDASSDCLAMVSRYLEPGCSVVDVGCGVGPYGPPLIAQGFRWFGAEVKADDCAEMSRKALPSQQITPGEPLPFADGQFDAAICIEVLEHIADTGPFLTELARVVKGRVLFSVPNAELIPMLGRSLAVPWHLLEADHKNFFTHLSLGALLREYFAAVEILDYGMHPITTPEGEPLPYHLFAIADRPAGAVNPETMNRQPLASGASL